MGNAAMGTASVYSGGSNFFVADVFAYLDTSINGLFARAERS
jgi:hypothetical protein